MLNKNERVSPIGLGRLRVALFNASGWRSVNGSRTLHASLAYHGTATPSHIVSAQRGSVRTAGCTSCCSYGCSSPYYHQYRPTPTSSSYVPFSGCSCYPPSGCSLSFTYWVWVRTTSRPTTTATCFPQPTDPYPELAGASEPRIPAWTSGSAGTTGLIAPRIGSSGLCCTTSRSYLAVPPAPRTSQW